MRRLAPALLIPAVCLALHADSTGRISGKVVTKEGTPIVGAKIVLKRLDRAWEKEIKTDSRGVYMMIGLDPVNYQVTVSAEGYQAASEPSVKVPLGDEFRKDFTLLTLDQAHSQAIAAGTAPVPQVDPGLASDDAGRQAFNLAIPLYNDQKYAEALPNVESAYKNMAKAMDDYKDEKAKADLKPEFEKVERVYGICLALGSPDRKAEAEPILTKALEANPKDDRALAGLIEIAKAKGDKAAQAKYQDAFDHLHGSAGDLLYKKAGTAFNENRFKDAKAALLELIQKDPNYADAYYLLGMVDANGNNMKGAKQNLQKYIELAPTGKHAEEVKEMLSELKHIK